MAKLSTIKRLIMEDFPSDHRKWLGKLITPLNSFLEQVYKVLTKGITIDDNLKAEQTQLVLNAGETTRKIKWTLNEKPNVVLIGKITYDNGDLPSTQISMYWSYANSQITVNFLGLDVTTKYRILIIGMV